ncbi:BRCT domain-containing protein [Heterostelium album PN500]|uniref:BRCT domain-containing protein n=1 Tax=Heterostelium pallidum (strain ATCC 26659 / Pp 5 / PN500) TaxID=670386 RepID=D3BRW4_HETP5|nr:BRCT domain-containing protein [Heterostelium album PN500]EFA76146.1 BRCT domain-containing protein [Heterostelium album PN500]|eukprot:XP_020428280.1 BRCT domain-containing protein [Heterostelium album PN500]
MTTLLFKEEIKWFWYNDSAWVAYTQAQIDDFEAAYAKKPGEIKVDNDRFIDLKLTHTEIVNNFSGINDKDLIGIQRRYDDHMKRRAVKRTHIGVAPLTFFHGIEFCFMETVLGGKSDGTTATNITKLGGILSTKITPTLKFLVISSSEVKKTDPVQFNKVITDAEAVKAVPVESNYIKSCVSNKKKLDHTPFIVAVPVKVDTATPTPVATPVAKLDSSYVLAGSEWAGVCTVDGDHYPMTLKVDTLDASTGELNGTLSWATLGGAITKIKGTVKEGKFDFEEYELVSGDPDEIELPNSYVSTVSLESMTGNVDGSIFQLKLTKSPPVTTMKPYTNYKGKVTQIDNFKLKVLKREDEKISGTLHWPYYNATAEFDGTILEETITIKQYKEGKELGPELKVPFNIVVTKVKDQINMKISIKI